MVKPARDDCTVGSFEKSRNLPTGTMRHENGRKMRKDKTIKAVRRDAEKRNQKRSR